MDPSSSLLSVPITFQLGKDAPSNSLLKAGCSKAKACLVKSWGLEPSGVATANEPTIVRPGALIGTEDGSLYFLKPKDPQMQQLPTPRTFELPSSGTNTPLSQHRDNLTSSRSSTPSITSPLPFNVTSRARIVSGITADSVEAPKNYVDFDDEPEKLKDMLKGKSKTEKKRDSVDEASLKGLSSKNSSSRSLSAPPPNSSRRTSLKVPGPATPRPSKAQVPALSLTLSSPPATASRRSFEFDPWCHTILPRRCARHAVTKAHIDESRSLAFVLQEMGGISVVSLRDGACLAHVDADFNNLEPPSGVHGRDVDHDVWLWNDLSLTSIGESMILLVTALTDSLYLSPETSNLEDSSALDVSRIALFEVIINDQAVGAPDISLSKVGEWFFDGIPSSAGIHLESDGTTIFHRISNDGHLFVRDIQLLPKGILSLPDSSLQEESPPHHSIPLPNPFKGLISKSSEHLNVDHKQPGRIQLEEEQNLGVISEGESLQFRSNSTDGSLLGAVWSTEGLVVFDYRSGSLRKLFSEPLSGIEDLQFLTHYFYSLLYEDRTEHYVIEARTGIEQPKSDVIHPKLLQKVIIGPHSAADIGFRSHALTTNMSDEGEPLCLKYHSSSSSKIFWQGAATPEVSEKPGGVTALLALDVDLIVAGFTDGQLRQTSFLALLTPGEDEISYSKTSQQSLNASIIALDTVQNMRTKERFIVGGGDDGSVAFWSFDQLQLVARWTIFISPLKNVVRVEEETESPLKGCALCISANGTIAVIAIDGFQFLFVIPGAAAPLDDIYIGGTNLMLIYADRRARLWDVQTREFWRSMKLPKAKEMLDQGGWTKLPLVAHRSPMSPLVSLPCPLPDDGASTLQLDLERFASESATLARTISTNRDQTRAILRVLERLKALLSVLLTPGLSGDIDSVCFNKLGIQQPKASAGYSGLGSTTLYKLSDSRNPWTLSPEATAWRLLSLTVILQTLSIFEEFIEGANTVLIFYSTSLSSVVGSTFQPPSLVSLARSWFAGSVETRKAARTVFDYAVACLSDDESNALAEHWQHRLPCLQPTAERESIQSALALYMCGYLAAERYSLLPTSTLVDISKSVALYLHDEQSLHRVLAVDLCSRGFHVWQHYIDAMEILRALFSLATATRKESISLQNVAAQARLAVLQIAASDTALFMHTLGLDILNPPSLEHRKSVLQIVAFLVRKASTRINMNIQLSDGRLQRPLVLQPNVPKLLEAVVKSLDPSVITHRDAVFDSATEIIGYVVNTFPSVDFNPGVQRLAVGTDEGAVIMYDVKTAIRLYVLEGHQHPVTACSFAPDGRRLLSLSLDESVVLVWKVGTSFTSFFTPGVPPRQGHGGSEPFKRFNFHLTAESMNMTLTEARDSIEFEWAGDRSVRLKIRETVMSFST